MFQVDDIESTLPEAEAEAVGGRHEYAIPQPKKAITCLSERADRDNLGGWGWRKMAAAEAAAAAATEGVLWWVVLTLGTIQPRVREQPPHGQRIIVTWARQSRRDGRRQAHLRFGATHDSCSAPDIPR